MTDNEFLQAFENESLPASEFTHLAHLRLAWIYLRTETFAVAVNKLTNGIKKYAEAKGAFGKYHCTITIALTCIIKMRLRANENFSQFCVRNEDLVVSAMKVLESHYHKETLQSKEAREQFFAPDLIAFPESILSELKICI